MTFKSVDNHNFTPGAYEKRAGKPGNFESLSNFCDGKNQDTSESDVHEKLIGTPWNDPGTVMVTVMKPISMIGGTQRIQLESHLSNGFLYMEVGNWGVGESRPSCDIRIGSEGNLPNTTAVPIFTSMIEAFRTLLGEKFTEEFPPCEVVASKDGFDIVQI